MSKKEVEYIIIGQGLAGSIIATMLKARNKTFVVFNKKEKWSSSEVAAGIFNPLTGPRVVKSWLADDIFPYSKSFFEKQEANLNTSLIKHFPVLKIFGSQEQQTDVLAKATERYKKYLNTENNDTAFSNCINTAYGTAEILKGGVVDVNAFRLQTREWLIKEGKYIEQNIAKADIQITENAVNIENINGKKLICCEGFHSSEMELFNWLPFSCTKGEMLTIKANLPETHIINKGCFILPKGNNTFLVGSSFERVHNKELTEEGKSFLTSKLDEILTVPYEVIDHIAGVRPTVKDRKPYLGNHPELKNVYIFNGLGAKGVTLGPFLGNQLLNYIENDIPLYKEVDINRYNATYNS